MTVYHLKKIRRLQRMQLFIGTEEECDQRSALEVIKKVNAKPNTVLGLATGSTPIGMYQNMVQSCRDGKVSFSKVKTFNLDEYVGLSKEHPCSYYYFMRKYLFKRSEEHTSELQ